MLTSWGLIYGGCLKGVSIAYSMNAYQAYMNFGLRSAYARLRSHCGGPRMFKFAIFSFQHVENFCAYVNISFMTQEYVYCVLGARYICYLCVVGAAVLCPDHSAYA